MRFVVCYNIFVNFSQSNAISVNVSSAVLNDTYYNSRANLKSNRLCFEVNFCMQRSLSSKSDCNSSGKARLSSINKLAKRAAKLINLRHWQQTAYHNDKHLICKFSSQHNCWEFELYNIVILCLNCEMWQCKLKHLYTYS